MDEQTLFGDAVEIPDPTLRAVFLERACAGDDALRKRVETLIALHEEAGGFLESPLLDAPASSLSDSDWENLSDETIITLEFLSPPTEPGVVGSLGPYEVVDIVARGAMGVVLKARDAELGRIVAVKVLSNALTSNARARRRFLREARAAASIAHPNVVTVHATGETGGLPYLVMEYVEGISLRERIARPDPIGIEEILVVGSQIARGLAAAHERGLVHRDVKPANILIEPALRGVKITDFGLARAIDDESLTQDGEIAGTPQFMSPEQAAGERVDHRTDLFSLGSVLYAMCTGWAPFRGDSTVATIRLVCEAAPRPIRETNPEIPRSLERIVATLMARRPEDRFPSAREVDELLSRLLAEYRAGTLVDDPEPKPSEAPRPRSKPRIPMPAAVFFCGCAVLLVLGETTGRTRFATTFFGIDRGAVDEPKRGNGGVVRPVPEELISPDFEWSRPEDLGFVASGLDEQAFPHWAEGGTMLWIGAKERASGSNFDIWTASTSDAGAGWTQAAKLSAPINTSADESAPWLAADGLTLHFQANRAGGQGGEDLWRSTRSSRDAPWSEPANLGPEVDGPNDDESPTLTADELTLVYASNREGGLGSFDLYVCERKSPRDEWSPPRNLGPRINSKASERGPRIAADGRVLIYRSGSELQVATRESLDAPWSRRPIDPIPGVGPESHPAIADDGRMLLFLRPGPDGVATHLWRTRRVPKRTP